MKPFLTNNICEFEILNRVHLLEDGVNILVSVFFKRDQYYKNFGIYIKGLQKVLNFVEDKTKNPDHDKFIFVLFIDQNIANDPTIMEMIEKSENTVPVLFKCAKYIKGRYHYDLFGTLVRFFPMFDFENNPCNITICIDIDLHDEDYVRLQCIMKHKIKGITAMGDVTSLLYKDKHKNSENHRPYLYAATLSYNGEKCDHTLITDFIRDADQIESKGHYGKRLTTFGFGIDEIFLNDFFIKKMKDYKTIIDYQISFFMYHSKDRITSKDKIDNSNEILSMILAPYAKDTMSINDKLNFIDTNTYQVYEKTEINDEISRRLTHAIDHLVKINKTWLEKDIQHILHKYLRNVISANVVFETNYTTGLVDIKLYDVVGDSDYVDPSYIKDKVVQE